MLPLERHARGYRIPGSSIHIDPLDPVRYAVVSHAHGDHASPGHEHVYCTPGTAALLKKRFDFLAKFVHPIPYGEVFKIDGIPFSFHPAGHMLGSAQIRWENEGQTLVYTGDFKRESDLSCEPFELVKCDMLITEVTFGQRDKTHPPGGEAVAALSQFKDINLLIGAYSLGKAQRLTRLIADHLPGFKVMVHPHMADYHRVYEEFGFKLGAWEHYKRETFKQQRNLVYLIPPMGLQNFRPGKHFLKGFATGWEEKQRGFDFQLPVSDHADWPSLLRTIRECGAKTVFTIHGEGEELKAAPELEGIDTHILHT